MLTPAQCRTLKNFALADWCNGTAWVDLGQSISVSSTAPASPALNDLWLEI